jgi:hypothetical protein
LALNWYTPWRFIDVSLQRLGAQYLIVWPVKVIYRLTAQQLYGIAIDGVIFKSFSRRFADPFRPGINITYIATSVTHVDSLK